VKDKKKKKTEINSKAAPDLKHKIRSIMEQVKHQAKIYEELNPKTRDFRIEK